MSNSEQSKASVMVVDDDEEILRSVKDYLTEFDYEVTLARDGSEALRSLMRRTPDLMLLDLVMPGMSGTELMVKLREMNLHLPIIIITGAPDAAGRLKGQEQEGVLEKPFSYDKMRAMVDRYARPAYD